MLLMLLVVSAALSRLKSGETLSSSVSVALSLLKVTLSSSYKLFK